MRGVQDRNYEELAHIRFQFAHSSDWSRFTRNKPFEFRSFRNYSLSKSENVEVLISKSHSKGQSVNKFLAKMVSLGKIYEIMNTMEFSSTVNIHVIIGPYSKTVRELLKKHDASSYTSHIVNGYQDWEVIMPEGKFTDLSDELNDLGTLKKVEKASIEGKNRLALFGQNTINLELLSMILSEKEFSVVQVAIQMGFFDETRKASITDIAKSLDRNKSTIDRELRSAVSKILRLIMHKTEVSSSSNNDYSNLIRF